MFVKRYVEVEFISQKHEILRAFNKLDLCEKKMIVMFFFIESLTIQFCSKKPKYE